MSNYTPYYEGGWKNEEEMTTTPICAEALNHMEEGISAANAGGAGGQPTPVTLVADMTDTSKIYLYQGSESGYSAGYLYYYSGGTWVRGTEYAGGVIVVDSALSSTSTNPVQNKVIYSALGNVESLLASI